MGRAPCCEKMGMKKGPWSPEEDQILINFIHNHGHTNWRALPKQAGLLRCGKSCRLRWTNYLKPDIKRGNFTREEEDSIFKLHQLLGNRWSAIAAKLPGRTDNEIKNVWHTHLKKRLEKNIETTTPKSDNKRKKLQMKSKNPSDSSSSSSSSSMSPSRQSSSSEISSSSVLTENEYYSYTAAPPPIDESFWSEAATTENSNSNSNSDSNVGYNYYDEVKMEILPIMSMDKSDNGQCVVVDDDMEFWYDVFVRAGGISELPEF